MFIVKHLRPLPCQMATTILIKSSKFSTGNLGFSPSLPKHLSDVCKIELFEDKSPYEISTIWTEYHKDQPSTIGFSVKSTPLLNTATILKNGKESPFFIHPIHNKNEFFVLLCQHFPTNRSFVFTDLESYKLDPAAAQPMCSFTIYDDFEKVDANVDEKLILARGDIISPYFSANKALAESAIRHTLEVYSGNATQPHSFNHDSGNFDVEGYLAGLKS